MSSLLADTTGRRSIQSLLLLWVCLLCLLVSPRQGAAATAAHVELTSDERSWLKAHPVIRLAPDPEFRPIEFFDETGLYQGMAADHIRLLEQKLGISITVVRHKNWDAVLQGFKAGEIELLGAVVPTVKRSEFMLFSDALFDVPGAIFVRKGSHEETLTISSLKGKRVAVVSNYTAHDILRTDYPEITLDVVPDTHTGLNRLAFGMVDAFVENVATASYYLQESALTNIRIAGTTDFKYRWAVGIRKDLPLLQSIINKGLAAITREERQVINSRWIPLTPRGWIISPRTLLALVALLGCGIAVVTIIWNRSLAREVTERKKVEQELALTNSTLEQRVAEEVEKSRLMDRIVFHQARLAAMGEMLHSIAHQWRQPLNNIAIYVQNLELEHRAHELTQDRLHQDIHTIMDIIQFMSATIDDFRTFFRQEHVKRPFSVQDTIRKSLVYMSARVGQHGITVETELVEDSELVGFASEYIQVLLNIISNAVDVLVKNKTPQPSIKIWIGKQDGCSLVTISDNGGGVAEELIERIFEPYFSTKTSSEGTGIGLFMAKNIVEKAMEGTLTVVNITNGAQFRIMI